MALVVPRRAVSLAELRAHRDQIRAIAARYGIRDVRVFGSVARDTATDDRDLDLPVEVEPGHGYLDLTGFALDVEDLLAVFTRWPPSTGSSPGCVTASSPTPCPYDGHHPAAATGPWPPQQRTRPAVTLASGSVTGR
jgi:uncharacterized protein